MAVAVAWAGTAARMVKAWRHFSFLTKRKENALVGFCFVKIMVLAYAIARILKRVKTAARRRATFWRILLCWQCRQDLAQAVMSLARPSQTNLEDTIHWEASLPGCKILNERKSLF